jgi:hypothetical protein
MIPPSQAIDSLLGMEHTRSKAVYLEARFWRGKGRNCDAVEKKTPGLWHWRRCPLWSLRLHTVGGVSPACAANIGAHLMSVMNVQHTRWHALYMHDA